VPVPLQVDTGLTADAEEQVGSMQRTPIAHLAQAPPWHRPVVPHVFCVVILQTSCGSRVPSLTVVQTPMLPARSHETHAVSQAELQHTPWAQCFDVHSASTVHSAPNGLRPHEPSTHTLPVVQSLSFVHLDRHFEPWQVKGLHVRADGLTHWPWLLHMGAGVYEPSLQVSSPQDKPGAYVSQAPVPSQRPSVPQLG